MALRKGQKPQIVLDESLEDHFARIKDNASDFDEAFELFNLLSEEMKYRVKQFGKCINATNNHSDWQYQTYASKLRRRLMNYFVE
jgi:hypothetical protein